MARQSILLPDGKRHFECAAHSDLPPPFDGFTAHVIVTDRQYVAIDGMWREVQP